MKKTFKRAVSVVSAAAVSLALVPIADYSFFSDAADQYSVRDPFYNYGSGYNYYESEHFQFIWGNSCIRLSSPDLIQFSIFDANS